MRWDVFCRVIDNYGDAGVCWRLARQLVAEHGVAVTLWIDRPATLARFAPSLDPALAQQRDCGVIVRRLEDDSAVFDRADVVIEGFGCGLPPRYVDAMAARKPAPLWINLEYLSAEPWVDMVHAIESPHPRLALPRYFWFPGFTANTGGLLREAGLLEARDAYQSATSRPARDEPLRIVLFSYPNPALPALFDTWSESDDAIACSVPEGVATAALDQWLRGDVPHAGQSVTHGHFTLDVVPFTTQDAFDRLLWRGDANFVRGEDSFVRAQWAARPFVWQPYPQEGGAHRLKLDAFLARYAASLSAPIATSVTTFWGAFNNEDGAAATAAWPAFRDALATLAAHGRGWAAHLATLPELGSGLVRFARDRL
jgi:uncharacterized repeat protein (TIGR03837 family)